MIDLNKKLSRKDFLKLLVSAAAVFSLPSSGARRADALTDSSSGRPKKDIKTEFDLVAATGPDPYLDTVKAVEKLGGMQKFVKKNDVVLVKPNIGWDRSPEQAGNTNPQVVAALIDMSFAAGAKRVNVFDVTCNDARRCYASSGIEQAAKGRGASVYAADDWNTLKAHFARSSPLEGWPILRDALECDCFINVPVLKHHGLTRLTLSMKNLMGVCGGNRGKMHQDIGPILTDLTMLLNPELTVIDAYRMLLRNGPQGGDLADVTKPETVIASTDPVLADVYACLIAGVKPSEVPYLAAAMERGYGIGDPAKARIEEIKA